MAPSPEAPGPRGGTLVGANGVAAPASPVITVRGLRMSYGTLEAVRGIDLEVHAGEVFVFLGPNGAGKTTTVEILEGFRRRTAGEVSVLDEDPERAGGGWRARIGVVLQESEPEPELTAEECLALYGGTTRAHGRCTRPSRSSAWRTRPRTVRATVGGPTATPRCRVPR